MTHPWVAAMEEGHRQASQRQGSLVVCDEGGKPIGTATWRAELGKWDCRDERFGIRAWAKSFARASATVRRLVEKKGKKHAPHHT